MNSAYDYAAPGAVIAGKYRVERVLGVGGMGTVVLAVHLVLRHSVAIKMLRPNPQWPGVAARFEREAMIAASLASEHVARAYDCGVLPNGMPFMVMEYLEGTDLRGLLRDRGPLRADEALGYLVQACDAVGRAHREGIVHRDLTPSNLFLARRSAGAAGTIKVLDFGVAQVTGARSPGVVTETGEFFGSPIYAAPEQLRSARAASPRSDVWSLGAVLYELLSASPPFAGETIPETCAQVIAATPVPLRERRPDVSARVVAIVERCLRKAPEERFADANALGAALEVARRELVIGAMDTLRVEDQPSWRTVVSGASSRPPVALPTPLPPRASGTRGWGAWAAAGALCTVAFGLWLSVRWIERATANLPPFGMLASTNVVSDATPPLPTREAAKTAGPESRVVPDRPVARIDALDASAPPPDATASHGAARRKGVSKGAQPRPPEEHEELPAPSAPPDETWRWGGRK